MCHHYLCKQKRAILVNSQKAFDFNCSHLESVGDCISPIKVFNDLADISTYPCDDSTRATLQELGATCMTNGFPVAVHVSPTMFCVFGKATTNSTAGYCHVRVTNEELRCCSKDCKSKMTLAKQQKSRRICIHIHVLLSLHILQPISENEGTCSSSEVSLTDVCGESASTCITASRKATLELKMKYSLPYLIPPAIVCQAGKIDASPSGWSEVFEPQQENCELCNGKLGHSKLHPGMRGRSVLIINMHPFKVVKIYVKMCLNCSAMHQVFPYEHGKRIN